MTVHVSVGEAAAHLSDLVQKVLSGEEVVIKVDEGGQEQVKLVPSPIGIGKRDTLKPRQPGIDEGQFVVPGNFNDPLPDEILKAFEGQ